jgi:hypothetical protein
MDVMGFVKLDSSAKQLARMQLRRHDIIDAC